jgi:hypothetical protein
MSNNSATLTPRLRQLLLMLSSDRPGEVTAAAAAIGRALKAAGTDWRGLVDGLLTEMPQPAIRHHGKTRPTIGKQSANSARIAAICCAHVSRNSSKVWPSGAAAQPRGSLRGSAPSTHGCAGQHEPQLPTQGERR